MKKWSIGVCRESIDKPWQFYISVDDKSEVFNASKDTLITALEVASYIEKDAVSEVWMAWKEALLLNAPEQTK